MQTQDTIYGAPRSPTIKVSENHVMHGLKNKRLDKLKEVGLYRDEFIRDSLDHWTDPAYVTIKPNCRASKPVPNSNMRKVKNGYSFNAWGDQLTPQKHQNVFESMMR